MTIITVYKRKKNSLTKVTLSRFFFLRANSRKKNQLHCYKTQLRPSLVSRFLDSLFSFSRAPFLFSHFMNTAVLWSLPERERLLLLLALSVKRLKTRPFHFILAINTKQWRKKRQWSVPRKVRLLVGEIIGKFVRHYSVLPASIVNNVDCPVSTRSRSEARNTFRKYHRGFVGDPFIG